MFYRIPSHVSRYYARELGLKSHYDLLTKGNLSTDPFYYPTPVQVQIGNQIREIVVAVPFDDSILQYPLLIGLHTMAIFNMTVHVANGMYEVCNKPISTNTSVNMTHVNMLNDFDYMLKLVNLTRDDMVPFSSLPAPYLDAPFKNIAFVVVVLEVIVIVVGIDEISNH